MRRRGTLSLVRLLSRKPGPAECEPLAPLLARIIAGYGRLILAPKDPRARAFALKMDRLAEEAARMADDPVFLARAGERLDDEVDSFARIQRDDVERTLAILQGGLRGAIGSLQATLSAGDDLASVAEGSRARLAELDQVGSYQELRRLLDHEIASLGEAVKLHVTRNGDAKRLLQREVAHLHARIDDAQTFARTDFLTKLPNRAELDEQLKAVREPLRWTLAIVDLDRFKSLNDTYGHSAGDAALIFFSERLKDAIGSLGLVARLSGDEFAVLARDSEAHILTRLRTLEEDLRKRPLVIGDSAVTLGVSFGTAIIEPDAPEKALATADGRMYLYKRARATSRAA